MYIIGECAGFSLTGAIYNIYKVNQWIADWVTNIENSALYTCNSENIIYTSTFPIISKFCFSLVHIV